MYTLISLQLNLNLNTLKNRFEHVHNRSYRGNVSQRVGLTVLKLMLLNVFLLLKGTAKQ